MTAEIITAPLTSLGAAAAAAIQHVKPRIIKHEPGVYFGLPDDDYFRDPALGSTDIKKLLISPADYWCESLYNERRNPKATRYLDRGHGIHAMVLFGEAYFDKSFARKIQRDDYPDALVTMADMKAALKAVGLSTSGKKEDLAARLRENAPRFVLFDDLVEEQQRSGKTILEPDDYDRIIIASAMIKRNPALKNCFENGVPEVSVFWEQDGVRFRARFDYLRMQSTIDLKSFTNKMERPLAEAVNSTFWNQRHDLQAAHYLNARTIMRDLFNQGRVFGDIDRDWLRRVVEVENDVFVFVYHQLSGSTVTRGRFVRRGEHVDGAASAQIARAADIWRENFSRFGEDMWVDMTPLDEVVAEDVPGWLRF